VKIRQPLGGEVVEAPYTNQTGAWVNNVDFIQKELCSRSLGPGLATPCPIFANSLGGPSKPSQQRYENLILTRIPKR
jgi:hypothetical protein